VSIHFLNYFKKNKENGVVTINSQSNLIGDLIIFRR
jgi:hypothetical protein